MKPAMKNDFTTRPPTLPRPSLTSLPPTPPVLSLEKLRASQLCLSAAPVRSPGAQHRNLEATPRWGGEEVGGGGGGGRQRGEEERRRERKQPSVQDLFTQSSSAADPHTHTTVFAEVLQLLS